MNGVPRATARAARGKRSIGAKVDTVVQPRWRNVPPSPQITCALAMTLPASDSRDHAGRSGVRAAVPIPAGQFGAVPCAATRRRRSRAARARHLFAWECPSSGKTDRNPARTRPRNPKAPHPSVTKPEGHFHFSWPHQPGKRTSGAGTAPVFFIARRNSGSATNIGNARPMGSIFRIYINELWQISDRQFLLATV